MQTEKDLELKSLAQFIGTTKYYKGWLGVNYTEGVEYVTESGYGWVVTDAISVIKTQARLKNEEFLVVKLKVHKTPVKVTCIMGDESTPSEHEGVRAELVIDDGNNNVLYAQGYSFTDAKVDLKLYFADNVMMLSGEY